MSTRSHAVARTAFQAVAAPIAGLRPALSPVVAGGNAFIPPTKAANTRESATQVSNLALKDRL